MDIIDRILNWLANAIVAFLNLLPDSPLRLDGNAKVAEILGYVNYFIPVGQMVTVMTALLGATIVWYAVRWVLRFSRYID